MVLIVHASVPLSANASLLTLAYKPRQSQVNDARVPTTGFNIPLARPMTAPATPPSFP